MSAIKNARDILDHPESHATEDMLRSALKALLDEHQRMCETVTDFCDSLNDKLEGLK